MSRSAVFSIFQITWHLLTIKFAMAKAKKIMIFSLLFFKNFNIIVKFIRILLYFQQNLKRQING